MRETADIRTLQKIKRTHERVAVSAGAFMAVAMSIYFFTFSGLMDMGASGLLWFEVVSSVLFLFGLIFLKRLAFFITRLVLGANAGCRRALKGLTVDDLSKVPDD
jgi:hypothetical protein